MPKLASDLVLRNLLLAVVLLGLAPLPSTGGGIVVLEESDSLRTKSARDYDRGYDRDYDRDSNRRSRGIRIRVETGDDSDDESFEVYTTDWDTDSSGDIVRFGESIAIGEDEIVEGSVVAIGGSIRVDGIVEEDVVALGGTIHLGPTAVVEGDVVLIGGRLIEDPGSEVYGEDVGMSFTPAGWLLGGEHWGGTLFRTTILASTFLFLFLSGIVFQLMFPSRIGAMARVLRTRVWMSLFAGVALHVLFGPVLALLTIIVIGIPVAILLPFAYVLVSIAGSVVAAAVLGSRLQGADLDSRSGWIRSLGLGLLLLIGCLAIGDALASMGGVVGSAGQVFLLIGLGTNWTLTTIGMGSALLSRFGGRNRTLEGPPAEPSAQSPIPPLPPVDPLTARV